MIYPKISIVTPSYNQGNFLEQTIQSVINQNYPNLEYIIMDGGSTDNSVDIIKKYSDKLTYWVSEPDKGMYDAIQKGFKKSSGEIMGWINSDDVLFTKSLFTIAEIFTDYPVIEWLNGIPNHMDEDGRIISTEAIPKWNKYRYLKCDYRYIQQEGMFWRRLLWVKAGEHINTNYALAADLELWSRFFMHAELYYVSSILGTFRLRSKSQKSLEQFDEYNKEAFSVLESMPATKAERKNIHISKTFLWQLSQKRTFRFLSSMLNYNKVKKEIDCYPPILYYNRFEKKFLFPGRRQ